ncbi:DUF4291 domain-containing protein [Mariniblastus sp.]|nr:DUF4291 domain-containing protein [Mariniblastus sp.]
MTKNDYREIRASYDRDTIVVYQAYRDQIAKPAIDAGKFVPPFSWRRMTWIKPSFLWMMARCNWGKNSGQENVLAIRIRRDGWEKALSLGILTMYERGVHSSQDGWREDFEDSKIHVQWDPERTIHGKKLEHRTIQVGISRHLIEEFTNEWIVKIEDATPLVKKMRSLYLAGNVRKAKDHLPKERRYPICDEVAVRLGIEEN